MLSKWMASIDRRFAGALLALTAFVLRRPRTVVALAAILAAGSVWHAATHLSVQADMTKMIRLDPSVQAERARYEKEFPLYEDTLLVVVDGPTPEAAESAAERIAERLRAQPEIFRDVFDPMSEPFFRSHGLLYRDVADLQDFTDNVARAQPFLSKLARDPGSGGLFGALGDAIAALEEGKVDALRLAPIMRKLDGSLAGILSGSPRPLSWSEMMLGGDEAKESDLLKGRRRLILAQPKLDFAQMLPARASIEAIRAASADLSTGPDAVLVRITGELALNFEELRGIRQGATMASVWSLVQVTLVLMIAYVSMRLVLATFVSLVLGLAITLGFASVAVGELNMISVAFSVLYIGLGVEYAIHFSLRFRDFVGEGPSVRAALAETLRDMGPALTLCALATAIGFLAFVPTDYRGVSELGLISGAGIVISLLMSITVLPALLEILSHAPKTSAGPMAIERAAWSVMAFPSRFPRAVRYVGLALAIAAVALLPRIVFDYDPINLRDPRTESVQAVRDVKANSDVPWWTIVALAPDDASAITLADRIDDLSTVGTVLTIHDFVPKEQEEKLPLVEDLAILLGPDVENPAPLSPASPEVVSASIRPFAEALARFAETAPDPEEAAAAKGTLARVREWIERFDAPGADRAAMAATLESTLMGTLPAALARLSETLSAGPVEIASLPASIRDRWVAADGTYRLEVRPKTDPTDSDQLRAFVGEVRSVAPGVLGEAVVRMESGDAVISAFQQAFATATVVIFILVLILLRDVRDALMTMVPLLMAGLLTGGVMVLRGIPFNYANVIGLPLLLGTGVDSGIHIIHRYRTGSRNEANDLIHTSASRGVFYGAITNVISFGNLAFLGHQGLSSMGLILATGLMFTLACALLVLPALLEGLPMRRHVGADVQLHPPGS